MSYASLRQEPSQLRMSQPRRQNPDRAERRVPLIPRWGQRCGAFFLVPALSVVVMSWHAGLVYGADRDSTLLAAAGSILAALWWFYYAWQQTRLDRALRRMSQPARVDRMSGRQFEKYCIGLLQARGYPIVDWPGRTRTITVSTSSWSRHEVSRSPSSANARKDKLGPNVIRELIGATASGPHKGLARMMMTNVFVTGGARAHARRSRIKVVDRRELHKWMDRVRSRLDQRQARRTNLITLVTLVMAGTLCSAAISVGIVVDQAATHPHSTAPAPDSLSASARSSQRTAH